MADTTVPTADTVLVEILDPGADLEQLDRMTLSVRSEIMLIDVVDSVRAAPAGPPPEGTRGLDVAAVGALVVAVAPTVEALGKIITALRTFVTRPRAGSTPTLKLTVEGRTIEFSPTKDQQQALVDSFLAGIARDAT